MASKRGRQDSLNEEEVGEEKRTDGDGSGPLELMEEVVVNVRPVDLVSVATGIVEDAKPKRGTKKPKETQSTPEPGPSKKKGPESKDEKSKGK